MDTVDLEPAARRLGMLISHLPDDELGRPTPCPAYTVGDLVQHVGTLAQAFTAAARKAGGPLVEGAAPGDAARLEPSWREQIPRDLLTLAAAWQEPGAWAGMTRIAGMDAPGEMVGLTVSDEIAVHGWDLAQGTGQPWECEADVLAAANRFLDQFASPDAPAGPEVAFGPSRTLPDDAPPLDRVVARAGRDLDWAAR
ncbi:MAG TPA: TIGR03086 family metal-binding protein [Streptosporangiaceae bacterium]|nr:TIGR03086 family metal-binding protein [Streptosporangiaceae bacterium]